MRRHRPTADAALVTASALAVLAVSSGLLAQPPAPRRTTAPHTVVELIADAQPEASTRDLWLGLRFELEQGWHVYWQNPGDSGGPPTVLWQPAPGVAPGEFGWPTPERIPLGPLVNYGYTNEVVLPFEVQLKAGARADAPVRLEGQFKWLICHDICIPGQARLSIALPLPPEDRLRLAGWHRQIRAARDRVPRPAPATWQARATSAGNEFVLTVRMDRPAAVATFFPLNVSQIKDAAPQRATTSGRELVIRLEKSDQLAKEPQVLSGVLAFATGEAVVVDARVGGVARGSTVPPRSRQHAHP